MSDQGGSISTQAPHDLEAERAVLGAMLIDPRCVDDVREILRPEDLYHVAHQATFRAICAVVDTGAKLDTLSLANQLRADHNLDVAGGIVGLSHLSAEVASAANVHTHAAIVAEKSLSRQLIEQGLAMANEAAGQQTPAREVAARAVDGLSGLIMGQAESGVVTLGDSVDQALAGIEAAHRAGGKITGVPTGFDDLDTTTSGWQPGDLIILAARPSVGKTALALDLARSAARDGASLAIFSLEMAHGQLSQRMLAQESRVPLAQLRTGNLGDEQWRGLCDAAGRISQLPIRMADAGGIQVSKMAAQCKRIRATAGLGLVIVDYIQLMSDPDAKGREQEVSAISRGLKGLARTLGVPVLALSQMSREVEKRPGHRPMLSDLRESGSIEQDADVVLFLYRPWIYGVKEVEVGGQKVPARNLCEVIVAKQRNGPTGSVWLQWDAESTTFASLAPAWQGD